MKLSGETYDVQGVPIADLCREFGTPLYIYDANTIIEQVKKLNTAFAGCDLKIKFACKALTNISILKLLRQQGVGVDVVSINEARLALKAGFMPQDINFTPSCVDFEEVREAVSLKISLNLDSLPILEQFGRAFGNSYPCGIRLNPHIMAGGNLKISTGHSQSKFGISIQQMDEIKKVLSTHQIQLSGLHIHTGSEIKETEVFMKMADILFDLAKDFPTLSFVDFGGGFKVSYKEGDQVTDLPAIGSQLSEKFKTFKKQTGRSLQLWIEPGKFLVSECGLLATRVTVVKDTPALTFAGVDTGLNHLIRPMMYNAYHEIVNVSNPKANKKTYTVVGNICETDTLGADRELNEVRQGDVLVLKNAGAYGFSMASNYNSRFRPAEVLVRNGKGYLIRDRDTFEDLLRGQHDVIPD